MVVFHLVILCKVRLYLLLFCVCVTLGLESCCTHSAYLLALVEPYEPFPYFIFLFSPSFLISPYFPHHRTVTGRRALSRCLFANAHVACVPQAQRDTFALASRGRDGQIQSSPLSLSPFLPHLSSLCPNGRPLSLAFVHPPLALIAPPFSFPSLLFPPPLFPTKYTLYPSFFSFSWTIMLFAYTYSIILILIIFNSWAWVWVDSRLFNFSTLRLLQLSSQ